MESPTRPDVWRGQEARTRIPDGARPGTHHWNANTNFNSVNRNKKSLCLDLDSARGKELFVRLAERADLVMENYTPRVMDNFGLGYEALRRFKEDLIMVSFSGFGATGPWSNFRAIGASTEMHAGWDALIGYADRPPILLGSMYADAISGLQMAAMALVALEHRDQTGEGQRVEGGMFEASVSYIGEELMRASLGIPGTERRANRSHDMAPHGAFPCVGEDRWLAIAVRDDDDWRCLVRTAGPAAGLDRPEFATMSGRLDRVEDVERAVAAWTSSQEARDLMLRLQAAGVPAGVVQNTAEMLADEHLRARGWLIPMTHADLGTHRYAGFAWRFSRSELVAESPPPRLGEHSRALLSSELGLSEAEIDVLFADGVTGQTLAK